MLALEFFHNVRIAGLFSFHFVVHVDVTILTVTVGIEFIMRALPWLFGSAIFMVAVVTHSLCVVLSIIMPTVNILFFAF